MRTYQEYKISFDLGDSIPNLKENVYKKWFDSSDLNCTTYKYEILSLSGSKNHNKIFKIDQDTYDIKFFPSSPGTFSAFIHPITHKLAESAKITVEINSP